MTRLVRGCSAALLIAGLIACAACSRTPEPSVAHFTTPDTGRRLPLRADVLTRVDASHLVDTVTTGDLIVVPDLSPAEANLMLGLCAEPEAVARNMRDEIAAGGTFRVDAHRHVRVVGPLPEYRMAYYTVVTDDAGCASERFSPPAMDRMAHERSSFRRSSADIAASARIDASVPVGSVTWVRGNADLHGAASEANVRSTLA